MLKDMLKNVEFFNVGELREKPFGYGIQRFPEEVYKHTSPYGGFACTLSDHCEIRFVRENPENKVSLTFIAEEYKSNIVEMRGDRVCKVHLLQPSIPYSVWVEKTPTDNINEPEFFKDDVFSNEVVRLIFTAAKITLCDIDTYGKKIRPPKKEELPQKTFLAYGSSVSFGNHAFSSTHGYIAQAARLLGCQALNKAMGGSCFMEKEVVDYITDLDSDFFVFEPGTNMYGNFDNDVILERSLYVVNSYFKKHPDNYIFMLEPPMPRQRVVEREKYEALRQTIHKIKEKANNDKLILLDILDVEKSSTYLTTDTIHLSTEGHMMMGTNLAELIRKYI